MTTPEFKHLVKSADSCPARQRNGGFTLAELMIVVVILGLLASIALPTFTKYTRRARTVEAVNIVSKLMTGALAYFMVSRTSSAGITLDHQFPGPNISPTEADCCSFTGAKCPGNSAVYTFPPWPDLNFGMSDPHFFVPAASTMLAPKTNFRGTARGNLDCDTTFAVYQSTLIAIAGREVPQQTPLHVLNDLE